MSQASHDINHRGNYSSRKYFCLLSHWHTCYSNLVRFVRDMMNIHDPGVPAASGQCYVICSQQGLLISRKALMTFEVFDVVYQSCLHSK